MQRAIFQPTTITPLQIQATRVLPGHGTGAEELAVNDEIYADKNTLVRDVLAVLINVVGGALLLSGLLFLPHIIAGILS